MAISGPRVTSKARIVARDTSARCFMCHGEMLIMSRLLVDWAPLPRSRSSGRQDDRRKRQRRSRSSITRPSRTKLVLDVFGLRSHPIAARLTAWNGNLEAGILRGAQGFRSDLVQNMATSHIPRFLNTGQLVRMLVSMVEIP